MTDPRGTPISPWLDRSKASTWPSLAADRTCEVAVIGGGIVGVATAYLIALYLDGFSWSRPAPPG